MNDKPPATPRLAATVMLLRDRPVGHGEPGVAGLEVFMVVRHHQIDFATGALVFPGGSLDKADCDPILRSLCDGATGLDDDALALHVAAIRESFEEAGVLLARHRGERVYVSGAEASALFDRWAHRLEDGSATMAEFAQAEGLVLAADAFRPFAHWITPEHMPKRFDTMFFIAEAPIDHAAKHDGREAVDSVWIRPADAIAEAEAGKRTIIFPTRVNLEKLGRSANIAEAFAAAARDPIVTVLPKTRKTPEGRVMMIPIEAGYGFDEIHIQGEPGGTARRVEGKT